MDEVILNLFNEFHDAVKNLKRLSCLSQEEFLPDIDKIDSAKYNFVKAIEEQREYGTEIAFLNNERLKIFGHGATIKKGGIGNER